NGWCRSPRGNACGESFVRVLSLLGRLGMLAVSTRLGMTWMLACRRQRLLLDSNGEVLPVLPAHADREIVGARPERAHIQICGEACPGSVLTGVADCGHLRVPIGGLQRHIVRPWREAVWQQQRHAEVLRWPLDNRRGRRRRIATRRPVRA